MEKKLDAFKKYEDIQTKRLQLVYLAHNGFTPTEITKWVEYAEQTIKNYIRKFASLLEEAKKIFYKIFNTVKKVALGPRQLVYLFKFYDTEKNLVCSKVGTTTRLPEERAAEEIKYYQSHKLPIDSVEICSVIDCGDIPCEGAESITRAYFIRKFPKTFYKNDRFFGIDLPTRTFNSVVKNYLENAIAY